MGAHIWRSRVLLSLACPSPSMRTCHARRLQREEKWQTSPALMQTHIPLRCQHQPNQALRLVPYISQITRNWYYSLFKSLDLLTHSLKPKSFDFSFVRHMGVLYHNAGNSYTLRALRSRRCKVYHNAGNAYTLQARSRHCKVYHNAGNSYTLRRSSAFKVQLLTRCSESTIYMSPRGSLLDVNILPEALEA